MYDCLSDYKLIGVIYYHTIEWVSFNVNLFEYLNNHSKFLFYQINEDIKLARWYNEVLFKKTTEESSTIKRVLACSTVYFDSLTEFNLQSLVCQELLQNWTNIALKSSNSTIPRDPIKYSGFHRKVRVAKGEGEVKLDARAFIQVSGFMVNCYEWGRFGGVGV